MAVTLAWWPDKARRDWFRAAFQIRADLSDAAVAIRAPSGLKAMAVSAVREVDETGGWPLVPRVARAMPDLLGGLWARVGLVASTPPIAQAKPANSMTRTLAFFIMAFPKNRSRS